MYHIHLPSLATQQTEEHSICPSLLPSSNKNIKEVRIRIIRSLVFYVGLSQLIHAYLYKTNKTCL